MIRIMRFLAAAMAFLAVSATASAQKYENGLVDKTVAVIGNEVIMLSDIEEEIKGQNMNYMSGKSGRCELLETMMVSKLFLMQARVDSLVVNNDMVESNLSDYMANILTYYGGEENVEKQYGKPVYKLRQQLRADLVDKTLAQQMQQEVAKKLPELTPYDVRKYVDSIEKEDIPVVPDMYQLSQICIYPDREAANIAVKERLLSIRERIINGEKFSTLARIYSQDPGSARKGGELGMASKSIFWPAFSDAAMALKSGVVSRL